MSLDVTTLALAKSYTNQHGGSGAGSMDLRVVGGYVQYSTDGGSTWANLIAMADLKGDTGHTPVKGTDYWTAADKQEIVNSVIAALPDGTEVSY